jgi:hypothetical protein
MELASLVVVESAHEATSFLLPTSPRSDGLFSVKRLSEYSDWFWGGVVSSPAFDVT